METTMLQDASVLQDMLCTDKNSHENSAKCHSSDLTHL